MQKVFCWREKDGCSALNSCWRISKSFLKWGAEIIVMRVPSVKPSDRNKYTHGEVIFYVDESSTIISYINHKTQQSEYGIIDDNIIKSFFDTQRFFQLTFAKIFNVLINHNLLIELNSSLSR